MRWAVGFRVRFAYIDCLAAAWLLAHFVHTDVQLRARTFPKMTMRIAPLWHCSLGMLDVAAPLMPLPARK